MEVQGRERAARPGHLHGRFSILPYRDWADEGMGAGSPVHDCACRSGPAPQSAVPPRGGRSPFWDLGHHPHCSPGWLSRTRPPALRPQAVWLSHSWRLGAPVAPTPGGQGCTGCLWVWGMGSNSLSTRSFLLQGLEGQPLRVTLEEATVSSGQAPRLGWTRRQRRGAGLAGRARHRGSTLWTGALGTWGPPAAAPHLLCMASEGPDSKAQLGTRAPASPPEQDSPVGQSHGKLKVCGDLVSGKSVRAVSLASAHFMSLSCFGNPHNISNFFIVIRLAKVIWDQ